MEKQLMGEKAALQMNSPLEYEQGGYNGGSKDPGYKGKLNNPSAGEKAPIQRVPYNLEPINANTGKPLIQSIASTAPLGTTPIHGWTSSNTPMSKRSIAQSR